VEKKLKMEDNIKDMRERHKTEIKELQNNCNHSKTKTTESAFEKHTLCVRCGKLISRDRNWRRV
jgi:uncharacterized paraquat-inducible protein A